MPQRLRDRVSYANVVSTIALFAALGGTSYAALTITGRQVRNNSLTGVDIKNSSLTSADIRNASLRSVDFRAGELPAGPRGPQGLKGDAGPQGPTGATGAAGAPGATNVTTRVTTTTAPVGNTDVTAPCLAGERAVGGGSSFTNDEPEVTVQQSRPSPATNGTTPTGWTVRYVVTGIPHSVSVAVVCAAP